MIKKLLLLFFLLFSFCSAAQLIEKSSALKIKRIKEQLKLAPLDSTRIRLINELSMHHLVLQEKDSCKKYAIIAKRHASDFIEKSSSAAEIIHYKSEKAKALFNLSKALFFEDINDSFNTLQNAMTLWKDLNDNRGIASSHAFASEIYSVKGEFTLALHSLDLALDYSRKAKRKDQEAEIHYQIGLVKRYTGNYGDALEYNIKSLQIAKQLNDTTLITSVLLANGFNYMLVKKYPEALKNQEEALRMFLQRDDSVGIATTYSDMGVVEIKKDNLTNALDYHNKSLDIRLELGENGAIANSYSYISGILNEMDELEEALIYSLKGLTYAKRAGDMRFISDAYSNTGEISMYLADYSSSILYYDSLIQISRNNENLNELALSLTNIAEVYRLQGNTKKAIACLQEAEEKVMSADYSSLANIYSGMNKTYFKSKDYENAYRSLSKYQEANDSLVAAEKMEKITGLTQQLILDNKVALQKASQDKQLLIQETQIKRQKLIRNLSIMGLLLVVLFALVIFWRFKEKRDLNVALEKSITDLKATQSQLIQSEKMASLGELTAGIAHEIQNPLNFVNNFAEVTGELIDEMIEEIENGDFEEVKLITEDLKQNLTLINTHGQRAGSIVKGMLQHSRNNKGEKEPTDINKLADEYLRLAFHGLRAKDKTFNANFETNFDESLGAQDIVPQDIGRVILNLITNAFYAVNKKKKELTDPEYKPNVILSTKKLGEKFFIHIKDNGNGIPDEILNKLFQPFFSTKPAGEGTGLGLSLSYDIIKAHGGEIKVNTETGHFTEFKIILPIQNTTSS